MQQDVINSDIKTLIFEDTQITPEKHCEPLRNGRKGKTSMSLKFLKSRDKDSNLETHLTQSHFGKEILSELKHMLNFKRGKERKLEQIEIYIISSKIVKISESVFVTDTLKIEYPVSRKN